MTTLGKQLTPRWTKLPRVKKVHEDYWKSARRFIVVPAGRRSYKTEIAKRKLILRALMSDRPSAWYVAAAPTHTQAKRIWWQDLKDLVPPFLRKGPPREADRTLRLYNNAEITVMGLDVPQRIEGRILDGIVMDEYGNMKASAWEENVRPALSNLGREGWAMFVGVPEGRNHYYELYQMACADTSGQWATFRWNSSEVLEPWELALARESMDPQTYRQEYEASFEQFASQCYYAFDREIHAKELQPYNPREDLRLSFDFNVTPGIAVIIQNDPVERVTRQIGEVYIKKGSNTRMVCRALVNGGHACSDKRGWGHHKGRVLCYGDATGGARGTTQDKDAGTDWDIVREEMIRHFGKERVFVRVDAGNPPIRVRVNSMNTRLLNANGTARYFVSRDCKWTIGDFENTPSHPDGSGDPYKEKDSLLTHLTDACGYYCTYEHRVGGTTTQSTSW